MRQVRLALPPELRAAAQLHLDLWPLAERRHLLSGGPVAAWVAGDVLAAAGRVVLAGVLVVAVATKLPRAARAQLRAAVTALTGVNGGYAALLAVSALAAEALVAGLLLVPRWPRAGPLLFVIVMGGYLALTAAGYARGVQVPCACFGRSSRELLRLGHVARNGVLLALGVAVLGRADNTTHPGRPDLTMWIAITLVGGMSLAALLLALAAFTRTSSPPRSSARSAEELTADGVGLHVGAPLPQTALTSIEGASIATGDYADRPLLAAFFVPNCPSCSESVDELGRHVGGVDVLAAVVGPPFRERDALVERLRAAGVRDVVVDQDAATFADLCEVDLFPTTLYFDHGVVGRYASAPDAAT